MKTKGQKCSSLRENEQSLQRAELTGIKLDEICNLATLQVDADCVVDLDEGVGVADGAGVVGHQVGDSFGADEDLLHLAQLVLQRQRMRFRRHAATCDWV